MSFCLTENYFFYTNQHNTEKKELRSSHKDTKGEKITKKEKEEKRAQASVCLIFCLCSRGRLRGGKTFSGRTILHDVAVWMDKLEQRGAKLKL
jgi:hypothetical protein